MKSVILVFGTNIISKKIVNKLILSNLKVLKANTFLLKLSLKYSIFSYYQSLVSGLILLTYFNNKKPIIFDKKLFESNKFNLLFLKLKNKFYLKNQIKYLNSLKYFKNAREFYALLRLYLNAQFLTFFFKKSLNLSK